MYHRDVHDVQPRFQISDLISVYGDGFRARQYDGFALETITRELLAEEFPSTSPLEQAYVFPL